MKSEIKKHSSYRLGIDIGGTFTDLSVVENNSGKRIEYKTPTISSDPARGVINGIDLLMERRVLPEQLDYIVHGTTIGLNTIIERSGSKIALLVTEGFRDILELGRIRLPLPWNFYSRRPDPLIPRELVIPVKERMRKDGVEIPLEQQEINNIVNKLISLKVEGVAICLLHSYANSTHEIMLKNAIEKAAPHLFVSASSEIWPQMREYERATATVMNAYLHSIFSRYLIKLEESLLNRGVNVRPYITRSNGGIMSIDSAKERPVETLLSGPASGVIGALDVGKRAGLNDLVILDMGGTSADVSIIENGKAHYTHEEHVGDFPLILPSIAISSIGAGGGSIAWLDGAEVLKVGPKSAGADPGPACYGRGGTNPTLSDAFLLCGLLNPINFASETELNYEASKTSMQSISESLDLSIEEAATAVIQVGLVNMYTELSAVIERKGIDPREFTLVSFGGAGSIVACQLAEEVNIEKILIPPSPGTLSAFGSLNADITDDFISTLNWQLDDNYSGNLESTFEELRNRGMSWLEREATNIDKTELQWTADMRYKGQSYEIEVLLKENWIYEQNIKNILTSFHQTHKELFNHSDPNAPVEMINLRLKAIGLIPEALIKSPKPSSLSKPQASGSREVRIKGVIQTAQVFPRSELAPGHQFDGPAIIEQLDTTVIVSSGWIGDVDKEGNIIITRKVDA